MSMNEREVALRVVLCKEAYLRPGEAHLLRNDALSPPAGGPQSGVQHWTVTTAPEHRLEVSKAGISDDSIILDSTPWLGPMLAELGAGRDAEDFLLKRSESRAVKAWDRACAAIRVRAHRYQLRRSGASSDTLDRRRSAAEVMSRGRWATPKSVRRYAKPGVLQRALHGLHPEVRELGKWSVVNLEAVLNRSVAAVVPDLAHLAVVSVVQ